MKLRYALCVAGLALLIAGLGQSAWGTADTTCQHGASDQPCRPDPQPDHGSDCTHPSPGNPAGINQDHCDPTTTTITDPSTTTTTEAHVTTTTTSTTVPTRGQLPLPHDVTGTESVNPPVGSLGCVTPDGDPYLTDPAIGGCPSPRGSGAPLQLPDARSFELARTGTGDTLMLILAGLLLVLAGLTAWYLPRLITNPEISLRERDPEAGFTLIELMVVVMIIAILMGIGIPAFLGARRRAQDTGAKSTIRNTLSSAEVIYSDNQNYPATAAMVADLGNEESQYTYNPNNVASSGSKNISVLVTDAVTGSGASDEIVLAAHSASGKCWAIRRVDTPAIIGMSGTYIASTGGACTADAMAALPAASWGVM